jgi:hypothetical protein
MVSPTAAQPQAVPHLQSLQAIREECHRVYQNIHSSQFYTIDESKLSDVATAIHDLIKTDYNNDYSLIKPHGRWRHIPDEFIEGLTGDQVVDLFTVSVLLDAGAGALWKYEYKGNFVSRSEGIAVAVAVAFIQGKFSSQPGHKMVDAVGLLKIDEAQLMEVFQVNNQGNNVMTGLRGRVELLNRLGRELQNNEVFSSNSRPSGMVDFIKKQANCGRTLDVEWFWKNVIIDGFNEVWPEGRVKVDGVPVGDVHFCKLTGRLVPFHKLSQWLCYSLLEPLMVYYHFELTNERLQTGLAEYRNGGLFIDYGVIVPRFDTTTELSPSSEAVVEWRALTVCLLDILHDKYFKDALTLPQLLEAGTWKAGRMIARQKRSSGAPPLAVQSDGTLF